MPYTTLFFDLDDTLYPNTNGLWAAIRERMTTYMHERMRLPPEDIPDLRRSNYETYGTTLRGLQNHHQVDAEDFLTFVHDLPLENYLVPDANLLNLLLSLPQNKWIFTNADAAHAQRVLAILGLESCFTGIIDVRAVSYCCKPALQAYRQALTLAGEDDPHRCVLLDDSPRNLAPARELGFTTILVGTSGDHPAASYSIASLLDLPQEIPQLWEASPGA
jgi:pyrimidine 5'-nucleotidase